MVRWEVAAGLLSVPTADWAAAEGGAGVVPMKPEPRYRDPHLAGTLSLCQLARRWGISRSQVRRLLGRQQLDFVQIRGSFRVPLAEVERYEKSRRLPG